MLRDFHLTRCETVCVGFYCDHILDYAATIDVSVALSDVNDDFLKSQYTHILVGVQDSHGTTG